MAARRGSRTTLIRPACRVALAGLLSLYFSGLAISKDQDDSDDESAKPASTLPNIYLDLRTNYATVPANALSIGLSNPSLFSAFTISSWNVGFQADVYQQNGGSIPTITLQSTVTRSIPDAPLATTSLNTILEFDYALNEDETRGLLAGVQYTRVAVDLALARINPNIVGYVGGYYLWDNNWKLSGRFGVKAQIAWVPKPSYQLTFRTPLYAVRN